MVLTITSITSIPDICQVIFAIARSVSYARCGTICNIATLY
jgi:hypothetical protein